MSVPNSNLDRDDQSARAQAKNASADSSPKTRFLDRLDLATHLRLVKTCMCRIKTGRRTFRLAAEPEEMV